MDVDDGEDGGASELLFTGSVTHLRLLENERKAAPPDESDDPVAMARSRVRVTLGDITRQRPAQEPETFVRETHDEAAAKESQMVEKFFRRGRESDVGRAIMQVATRMVENCGHRLASAALAAVALEQLRLLCIGWPALPLATAVVREVVKGLTTKRRFGQRSRPAKFGCCAVGGEDARHLLVCLTLAGVFEGKPLWRRAGM